MTQESTLWQAEASQLANRLAGVHGSHGLVLAPQAQADLSVLRGRTGLVRIHYWYLQGEDDLAGAARAHLANWPVQADSLDLLVLWHVIDRSPFWPMVLEEAQRVLAPGGLLTVVYHDRLSPWRWTRARASAGWPSPGRLSLRHRLQDLGLTPLEDKALSWQLPWGGGERWQRLRLDRFGPFWPWPAVSRVAFSRLETPGMTPLIKRPHLAVQPAVSSVSVAGRQSAARGRQEIA